MNTTEPGKDGRSYGSIEELVKDLEQNPVEKGGHLYHPIPFPEFAHLKTSSNSKEVYRKYGLIKKTLVKLSPNGLNGLRILDVGANAGLYTFSLAKEGAQITSFEPHERYGPVGDFLSKTKGLDVDWHPVPFDPEMVSGRKYDVTLILSVFQWMANGGERMDEALKELRFISEISKYLVFELGFNTGMCCLKTSKRNHYRELIKMLSENTVYKNFKLLGKIRLWKTDYRYLVICSNDERLEDSLWWKLRRRIDL